MSAFVEGVKTIFHISYKDLLIPESFQQPKTLPEAFERANEAALSPEELDMQIRRHIFIQDQRGALSKAKSEGWKEGIEEGRAEGLAAGLIEALQRLLASGIDEATARQMLGLPNP